MTAYLELIEITCSFPGTHLTDWNLNLNARAFWYVIIYYILIHLPIKATLIESWTGIVAETKLFKYPHFMRPILKHFIGRLTTCTWEQNPELNLLIRSTLFNDILFQKGHTTSFKCKYSMISIGKLSVIVLSAYVCTLNYFK